MHTYANEELDEKITIFIDRKTKRFPDLKLRRRQHEHYVDIETLTDKIHSIWFKRAQA